MLGACRTVSLLLLILLFHSCASDGASSATSAGAASVQLVNASAPQDSAQTSAILREWPRLSTDDRFRAVNADKELLAYVAPPPPVILPTDVLFEGRDGSNEHITVELTYLPRTQSPVTVHEKWDVGGGIVLKTKVALFAWNGTDYVPAGERPLDAAEAGRLTRVLRARGNGMASVSLPLSVPLTLLSTPPYYRVEWHCVYEIGGVKSYEYFGPAVRYP